MEIWCQSDSEYVRNAGETKRMYISFENQLIVVDVVAIAEQSLLSMELSFGCSIDEMVDHRETNKQIEEWYLWWT